MDFVESGRLAFVGGIDLAVSRWDDRDHRPDNPHRKDPSGAPTGAHHGVSPTVGKTARRPGVRQIRALLRDAVDSAERSIYLETQYFSSRAMYDALVRRMRASSRPPLELVIEGDDRLIDAWLRGTR